MTLEFADDGTLHKYLDIHFKDLTWKSKYKLGVEIANGLRYLHEHEIVHKDLVSYHKLTTFIFTACLNVMLNLYYNNVYLVIQQCPYPIRRCKNKRLWLIKASLI